MADAAASTFNYWKGLRTREAEEGGASPDRWVVEQNVRVGTGNAVRRGGCGQVAVCGSDNSSVDLNGTTQYLRMARDPRVHTLGLYWTWRCLVRPDVVNATQYIFGEESAAPTTCLRVRITNGALPEAVVTLSDGTTHTMLSGTSATAGADLGLMVTRSTSTIKFWQNGANVVTVSNASATLLGRAATNDINIGRHDGSDYFNGKVDYVDAFSIPFPHHDDYRLRWPDPRAAHVLYSLTGELDAQNVMRDHGRHECHGKGVNTPTETTALAVQDAPVNGIHARLRPDGRQQFLLSAGGRLHSVNQ